ncbi:hypothetical protein [Helicobacter pylori]|uniref:hypothetical protein n=1 Tax=Helicobacter pylori TaxID=210 RepID=UPI001EE883D1|nr:hypothetical protein [Helicobacter pylori]
MPESDFYKNKQKFLDFFKTEEWLLYKSRFQQLGGFITEALLENSRKKIIESNCNKALKAKITRSDQNHDYQTDRSNHQRNKEPPPRSL